MPKCYNNVGTENNSEGQYSVHTLHGTHTNILKSKMFNLPKNNQSIIIVSRQKQNHRKRILSSFNYYNIFTKNVYFRQSIFNNECIFFINRFQIVKKNSLEMSFNCFTYKT